jgi:hypothetical protein
MLTKAFDKVGQEITKGCFIAYGHALGRCAGLRIGRVESVNFSEKKDYDWDNKKNILVDDVSITVLGIDDDWDRKKPKLLQKKSTLFFPERMIVLLSIPEKFAKLYEDDCVAQGGKHCWIKNEGLFAYKKCTVCHLDTNPFKDD